MSENLKAVKKLIVGLAEMYGEPLTETRMAIYAAALSDLSAEEVQYAVTEFARDPNQTRFPLPAMLREKIHPTLTVENAANELVGRAIQAVARFGYVDPTGAREYLGEIVWRALPDENGWRDFCCSEIPQGIARAQLRERIAAVLRRENSNGRVALPPPHEVPLRISVPENMDYMGLTTPPTGIGDELMKMIEGIGK